MEVMCCSETLGDLQHTALNRRISYYGIIHWLKEHERRNFIQVANKQNGV
jgi:hypothetical protein